MAVIYIDNVPHLVRDGQNLLQACLGLGFDIPYFCWHPALGSVGACRLCAVKQYKDENDTRGRIVMSCTTPATEGTRISIDDPDAKAFRRAVIEWLMLNHPHDCPVCDEGGECHLQDMTVLTGHFRREYRFRKRTHKSQDIGPFLNHEMNRCIQCYRCVRFYRDYAGGRDLEVFGAHDHVFFGRGEEGPLESPFSGNLVEVCPTGVFTDRTFSRHSVRKWDLQTAPSVCVHCGLGCNIIAAERGGKLRRILNRYNGEVNGFFLCDRGRFGYVFVNGDRRIREPVFSDTGGAAPDEAVRRMAGLLHFGANVVGIGSPRASLEANFCLRKLVGPERFFSGLSGREMRLVSLIKRVTSEGPGRLASLKDVRESDAVLILGEDVLNTAPVLGLAVRQAAVNEPKKILPGLQIPGWHANAARTATSHMTGPVFVAAPHQTGLDDIAAAIFRAAPDDIARLGFAVAGALSPASPRVESLGGKELELSSRIARCLEKAERPLLVSGTGCGSEAIIKAAANISRALKEKGKEALLSFVVPECNTAGLVLMENKSLDEAFLIAHEQTIDAAVVLENDLFRRSEPGRAGEFLRSVRHVIVLDHVETRTSKHAFAVLPASTFAESDGNIVNSEGRMQRCYKVFTPDNGAREAWKWLRDIMEAAGRINVGEWETFDEITASLAVDIPALRALTDAAPKETFRILDRKIPRQSRRASGRTALFADATVHEPAPPGDPDSPLAFSMEGFEGNPPPSLITRYWAPHWNSVQAAVRFQEWPGGPLKGGDPGIRIFEPSGGDGLQYFPEMPEAFSARKGEVLVVPLYHVFGSEELSGLAPAIAERTPEPYLAVRSDDMEGLGILEGEIAELSVSGSSLSVKVRTGNELPVGVAGLAFGLAGMDWADLPAWGRIRRIQG